MVSKNLLFSLIVSLAQVQVVISESSPGQVDVASNGLPDSTPGAGLVHIQTLLSQHITELSALLDNFKERSTGKTLLQVLPTNASAAPLACNCQSSPLAPECRIMCGNHEDGPIPPTDTSAVPLACNCQNSPLAPACRIMCGNHEDSPIPPADQAAILTDSNVNGNGIAQSLPPAGLLPLRFSCTCTPPILVSCKVLCANHGGTVWHPPNSERLAASSDQTLLSTGAPHRKGCNCNNPTPNCVNICSNHGGRRDNGTTGGQDNVTGPSHPSDHKPRPPRSGSDHACSGGPNICGNHGNDSSRDGPSTKAASDPSVDNERSSDQHQRQNASMPLPGTQSLNAAAAGARQLALSIALSDGSSTTISAAVDLALYASFASSSAIKNLGFAHEIHPPSSHEQSVTIHGQACKVIGTVALLLPDYGLHEVFYVVDPMSINIVVLLPELIVGVDFLQQTGGLDVKSHLLV